MILNKITFEFWQEADNEIGSEELQIIVTPALIGLFHPTTGDKDYYYTIKSADGFGLTEIDVKDIFEKIDKAVELYKPIK